MKRISKNELKAIKSLQQKKQRDLQGRFVVEGEKIVQELLLQDRFEVEALMGIEEYWAELPFEDWAQEPEQYGLSGKELERMSGLKQANKVLAVVAKRETPSIEGLEQGLSLVLDRLQNPGNLGTIIRMADWFGVKNIFCSPDCVDLYNPKVIQASMGSFLRVNVHYIDLNQLFEDWADLPRYGALLSGENVYDTPLKKGAFLLIGNESQGLSEELQAQLTTALSIPRFGGAESLNAAVATGILLGEFAVRQL